ncbi:serine--tRNA ligase [Candidatus Uhrbacteria bacterium RIFCSPHIGHO2_01_FULL_63_20]|uniref:Serine--tRNA ligase n=1 Tax=Candidatus Uhrbacteria bacterium RIFCSPHIGHO2_01_FULL_63_20 TaxID=1802385 RepID=A0A1F7TMX8_9BACT|nr:MAG: serine--tRNA ligase [Candidatus Uhrbacteria bacterium RIFCSPHIGHO2_01_FULL_63_20]
MIDPKLLLERPELVAENNRKRGKPIDVDMAAKLSAERAKKIGKIDALRERGNEIAKAIPSASASDRPGLVAEGKEVKEKAKALEAELSRIEAELERELRMYPNLLRDDVPEGKSEEDNKELRTYGNIPAFDFEPKDHLTLGTALGMIDVERGAKVSGARFAYFTGDAVTLELSLIQYALSVLLKEGFVPVAPPHLISTRAMASMGYLDHGGEEEVYHLKNDDLVLIGTSEQAIGPMLMDETLDAKSLPLRYVGISPCYRREAGSYGKDVKGIIRMHQFDKVEMFSFTKPEDSDAEHALLLSIEEKLMQGLGLPHRVLQLCSGDIGAPSARTYDIETWFPSQGRYRETHSTSNTTDFQTRRLNVRYKDGRTKGLAHALNGTAFAIGRTIAAILENNQQKDGSVLVPEVLRPWMGKDVIHPKESM